MSTAQEAVMKYQAALPSIDALHKQVEAMMADVVTFGVHVAIGRDVCARRARKLKRRGESVIYVGRTKTGKARYRWMRAINPISIYRPTRSTHS